MNNVLMVDLDEGSEGLAFNINNVIEIVSRDGASVALAEDGSGLALKKEDRTYPVRKAENLDNMGPYLVLHRSGEAFSAEGYRILFNVVSLRDNLLFGVDATGRHFHCRVFDEEGPHPGGCMELTLDQINEKLGRASDSLEELKDLKDMIKNLKNGHFFEALTMEFSGKVREIAQELIDFRKDIQRRIEPDIVQLAARDIPEASNQLEGINQTLESSTMKIMDINEEQMEMAGGRLSSLRSFLSENGGRKGVSEEVLGLIERDMECLKRLGDLSLSMMEPLSFQDLVGQRIQRIIKLVKSMEVRIEDLVISFGIKIRKHREDPSRTFEELKREVENYKTELRGPQKEGEGLDQSGIDELLTTL